MARDKEKHFVYEEDFDVTPNTSDYQSGRLFDGWIFIPITICNSILLFFKIITHANTHVEVKVQLGDEFRFVQAQIPVVGFRQEDAIKQNTSSAPRISHR